MTSRIIPDGLLIIDAKSATNDYLIVWPHLTKEQVEGRVGY